MHKATETLTRAQEALVVAKESEHSAASEVARVRALILELEETTEGQPSPMLSTAAMSKVYAVPHQEGVGTVQLSHVARVLGVFCPSPKNFRGSRRKTSGEVRGTAREVWETFKKPGGA